MPLAALQSALLAALRGAGECAAEEPGVGLSDRERRYLERLLPARGLAFTAEVRRSWCEMRATRAAGLTLAALPEDLRGRLISDWLDRGGGASSFFASEAEDFLEFIAPQLPPASNVLSICRFERAVHRAASAAAVFAGPEVGSGEVQVRQGAGASLVEFLADPAEVLWAAGASPAPPIGERVALLFAPGLPALWRPATVSDDALWQACVATRTRGELLAAGHEAADVDDLLAVGALELA